MIWPAPGVTADRLAEALLQVNGVSQPILAGAHSGEEVVSTYLRWVNEAGRILGLVARKTDLDRLVLTPRYWATLAAPNPTPATVGAVNHETEQRTKDIEAALKDAQDLRNRWAAGSFGTRLVVPDTGIFLHHPAAEEQFQIGTISWRSMIQARVREEVRVVVPFVVIDELERIKDNRAIAAERRSGGLRPRRGRASECGPRTPGFR